MLSIELVNICKSFESKNIINDINLKVEEGELVSLLGPSGCGKSTTLKITSGLLNPEEGDILLNGESVLRVSAEKRGAVIVFQEHLLFPHMTVGENIGFGLKMAGVPKSERLKIVKEMVDLVQLNGLENKYPKEISGGQSQRAALARALAIKPKVLLLDEPFSNLDQRLRESMREFVYDIQRKLGITTILVTHDKEEALMMSDKIAVMFDGRIVQVGTPKEVYNWPKTKEVADFFGDNNYIEGIVEDKILKCSLGEFNVNHCSSGKVLAMIRPEDVKVFSKEEGKGIRGVISKKRYAGDRAYYNIQINGISIKSIGDAKYLFDLGDEVLVDIDFSNASFYSN
jgi:ABC-type Fe3+/spermidine/putrescine transport system ATPase subunit